ncbi:MAG: ATP-dependent helicase HrpB [Paracoccaceae bacterium]
MSTSRLPIDDVLPDITRALDENSNLVLAAPPGAGKTTRLPLALLQAKWTGAGRILLLEPRRIAARTAAARMADTLCEPLGSRVGYRIRGDSKLSSDTRIEVITEGILTAMLRSDPDLPGIAAVLFDEVHERSIHTDLGLALCLEVQEALRPELRLVAMSATLETEAFRNLMPDARVIESAGRSFPVETLWLDRPRPRTGPPRQAFARALADGVIRLWADTEGDVLAFLPGAGEIRATTQLLEAAVPEARIQQLFGAMPFSEQQAVLQPSKVRRIVLATAIAETSLTVPGVRAVVDGGLARRARVDRATGLSRLVTEPVSRAEAAQRQGRAGRLGPGVCLRLWTKGEEGALPARAPPEILSTDLTSLALDLAVWGTRDPADLRFLDQPPAEGLAAARDLLTRLDALDAEGRITEHGHALARAPLHPRLGHMLKGAADHEGAAALLAALISDRPITGATGCDLRSRAEAVLRPGASHDRGQIRRIREEAKRLSRSPATPKQVTSLTGVLAARAYPDRIAQRRKGEAPRFLLSNGRGAIMDPTDPLSGHPYLVATDLEDGREARIRIAAPISAGDLRVMFASQLRQQRSVTWSSRDRRVEARDRQTFGALVLDDQLWRDPPDEAVIAALIDGIRDLGLTTLTFPKKAETLRKRIAWARANGDEALPDLADKALLDSLEAWLAPHLTGCGQISDLGKLDLATILRGQLDWEAQQRLDKTAPATFQTPLGSETLVDYGQDSPAVSVRLQEMFGTAHHPTIGVPPRPLLIHLLSPAQRPVQSTMDLPGFWEGSYADVRKDMRAQYPKHPWPENPAEATPTRRAKPRSR